MADADLPEAGAPGKASGGRELKWSRSRQHSRGRARAVRSRNSCRQGARLAWGRPCPQPCVWRGEGKLKVRQATQVPLEGAAAPGPGRAQGHGKLVAHPPRHEEPDQTRRWCTGQLRTVPRTRGPVVRGGRAGKARSSPSRTLWDPHVSAVRRKNLSFHDSEWHPTSPAAPTAGWPQTASSVGPEHRCCDCP